MCIAGVRTSRSTLTRGACSALRAVPRILRPHSSPVWVITIAGIDGEWKIERTGISRWQAA